jgi:hypothetical protein
LTVKHCLYGEYGAVLYSKSIGRIMTNYYFTTPTIEETPAGGPPLFDRYKLPRGITVLRLNGIYSSFRYPSQTQTLAAEEYYMGGTTTLIDQQTADALTAQGYGAYITPA